MRRPSKADRRRAIRDAALEVFLEQGYEAATTREIARRSGIATGTLFLYAADKRDLLLMIVNDDLDAVNTFAFGTFPRDGPLLDQLDTIFRPRYTYWGSRPALSRYALQERSRTAKPTRSGEMERYDARRQATVTALTGLIAEHQHAGRVHADESPGDVAWVFYAIFLARLRLWLAEPKPDVDDGMRALLRAFRIAIRGIATEANP